MWRKRWSGWRQTESKTAVIQPTHVINGIENDRMLEAAEAYRDRFETMQIGAPLLSTAEDYKKAVHAVMAEVDPAEDETLILMGHGTDHHANSAYPTLEYTFSSARLPSGTCGNRGGISESAECADEAGDHGM